MENANALSRKYGKLSEKTGVDVYALFLFAGLNPEKAHQHFIVIPYPTGHSGREEKGFCILHERSTKKAIGSDFMERAEKDPYCFVEGEIKESPRMLVGDIEGAPVPICLGFGRRPETDQLSREHYKIMG